MQVSSFANPRSGSYCSTPTALGGVQLCIAGHLFAHLRFSSPTNHLSQSSPPPRRPVTERDKLCLFGVEQSFNFCRFENTHRHLQRSFPCPRHSLYCHVLRQLPHANEANFGPSAVDTAPNRYPPRPVIPLFASTVSCPARLSYASDLRV